MIRIHPRTCAPFALALFAAGTAFSQGTPPKPAPMTRSERGDALQSAPVTTFRLKYATQNNDANEILTGLRLMLDPYVKVYLVTRDNTIILRGLPDDVALATSIVHELDRPRNTYRLTFTVSQFDGPRKLSSMDYSMTVLDGQRAVLKQGARIPVQTGSYNGGGNSSESQVTYLDVGLNFDATVSSNDAGAILREKVEQSSLPDPQPTPGTVDPIIHQTVLEGVSSLQLGRITPLGTLDSQGSTRRTQVDVKLEQLP